MDCIQLPRSGPACNADRRISLRALPFGAERRACRRLEDPRRAGSEVCRRRSRGIYRGRAPCALLLQNGLLCAGLHATEGRGQGKRLEPEHGRHRPDVARRMHHSQPLPGQDQGGIRQESRVENLLLDSFFSGALTSIRLRGARRWFTRWSWACPRRHSLPHWLL